MRIVSMHDCRSHCHKFGDVISPFFVIDFQAHTNYTISAQSMRFFFHARHGEFTRMIHGLG